MKQLYAPPKMEVTVFIDEFIMTDSMDYDGSSAPGSYGDNDIDYDTINASSYNFNLESEDSITDSDLTSDSITDTDVGAGSITDTDVDAGSITDTDVDSSSVSDSDVDASSTSDSDVE